MSAFILSVITNNFRPGQTACLNSNLLSICLSQLTDPNPMLRRLIFLLNICGNNVYLKMGNFMFGQIMGIF